jgi:hypothetical protein
MHPEAQRLFALDDALHAEADRVLAASGIGAIVAEYGYQPVGSYVMRTMTWRDLDFERIEDPPDWNRHWEVGTRLAKTGWCVRLQCVDNCRIADEELHGLWWGVRAVDPAWGSPIQPDHSGMWKFDIWALHPDARSVHNSQQRERWMRLLNEEARSHVLAIKEAVCHELEYRRTMLSIHIYEAVLEHGIRDIDSFRRWWEQNSERK